MPQDLFEKYNVDTSSNGKDLFAEAGIEIEQPEANQGWGAVGSDLLQELQGLPGALAGMPKALYEEIKGAGQQFATDPLSAASEVPLGAVGALEGLYNILPRAGEYAKEKGVPGFGALSNLPTSNIEQSLREMTGTTEKPGSALIGSLAPLGAANKLIKAPGLKGASQRGVIGGTYAAAEDESPVQGALLSMLGEGAMRAPGAAVKGAQSLKPSNMLKTNLSPEELSRRIEITKDIDTPLGDVIDNPNVKKLFENTLAETPFSGAETKLAETAIKIGKRGDEIMDNLKRQAGLDDMVDLSKYDFGERLKDALVDLRKDAKQESRQLYENVNDMAEREGVVVNDVNFRQAVNDRLKEIEGSKRLETLLGDGDLRKLKLLSRAGENSPLKTSDFIRADLGETAYNAFKEGKDRKSRIYSSLKEAIEKDIASSLEEYPGIKEMNQKALQFYKEKVTPFENSKEIKRYLRSGADSDLLVSSFVRRGAGTDRGNLIDSLNQTLSSSEKTKALLPLAYLSRSIEEGVVDPKKLKSLYKNLGPKQREALFDSVGLNEPLKDFSDLVNMNSYALNRMANPLTGQKNLKNLNHIIQAGAVGAGALTGGGAGALIGGAALPLAAKAGVSYLMSPKTRQKVLKAANKSQPDAMKVFADAIREAQKQSTIAANAAVSKNSDE